MSRYEQSTCDKLVWLWLTRDVLQIFTGITTVIRLNVPGCVCVHTSASTSEINSKGHMRLYISGSPGPVTWCMISIIGRDMSVKVGFCMPKNTINLTVSVINHSCDFLLWLGEPKYPSSYIHSWPNIPNTHLPALPYRIFYAFNACEQFCKIMKNRWNSIPDPEHEFMPLCILLMAQPTSQTAL